MPDGVRQPRQYSLTKADDGDHRQFSVKRVRGDGKPDGEVSNFLCDHVYVGDRLTMSLPFGDVVLDDSRPVVFASAGIGITPMAGMLSHLMAARSHLPIVAAARRRRRELVRAAPAGPRRRPRPAGCQRARLVRARRQHAPCPSRSTAGS